MVNCPRGANLAWSGPSGSRKGTETPQGPTASAESPTEATQAEKVFDSEKECNELQEDIESEEDPWASAGWVPMKRPCQKNSTLERKQVEKSSLGQDPEGRLLPVYDWPKRESCAGDQMGPVFCVQ